jgi:hypothetical protein
MEGDLLNRPQQLGEKADRCLRLARSLMDPKDQNALMDYGRELLDRAERMERALSGAGCLRLLGSNCTFGALGI